MKSACAEKHIDTGYKSLPKTHTSRNINIKVFRLRIRNTKHRRLQFTSNFKEREIIFYMLSLCQSKIRDLF